MQPTIQEDDTIVPLNKMNNVTFHCTCSECDPDIPPYWTLANNGNHLDTSNSGDRIILAQQGITFNSSGTSGSISIPDTIEHNNTEVMCAAFMGGTEFSESVTVTIIGKTITISVSWIIENFHVF